MKLKEMQAWFTKQIATPLNEDQTIAAPNIESEAPKYIKHSPTLKPHERIEIYNQQYWWRLINTMQEHFPLVLALFGTTPFNDQLAIPFLKKYKPYDWNINLLGEKFPFWIEENYHENDKTLVLNAAKIDWAYVASFLSKDIKMKSADLDEKLGWSPALYLFEMPYDLFSFRREALKQEADYWLDNPFPALNKGRPYYFIFYRNQDMNQVWQEIDEAEFRVLALFKKALSLNELCDILEDHPLQDKAEAKLSAWIQKWTSKALLVPVKTHTQPSTPS